VRLLVVVALVAVFALARVAYTRWRAGLHTESRAVPALPDHLVAGAARTWVVFTTPWCASCDTVTSHLTTAEPDSRVIKIDATKHLDLADAFHIRSAPTVLLADALGTVQQRLVGATAVTDYVAQVRIGQ
jgi:thiol-disulfide isomerase/thioredoxin